MDPIFYGDYPASMRERVGDRLPKFSDKEKETLQNSVDFLGLNHYTTRFVANFPRNPDVNNIYMEQEVERKGTLVFHYCCLLL